VKKTEGGQTILYINKYYEKNTTSGNVTTYYYLGSKLVAQNKGGTLSYIMQDHLGSTSVTADSSGNSTGVIHYFASGSMWFSKGVIPTDKKFTGQRLDSTGLYYYGARYYDPTIGRFISADTIIPDPYNPQSFNRYSYCYNNPLKYIDETGHFAWLAAAFIGAGVGALVSTISYVVQNHEAGLTGAGFAEAAVSGAVAVFVSLVPIPGVQVLAARGIMGAVGGLAGSLAGEGVETAANSITGNPDQFALSATNVAASVIGGTAGGLLGEGAVAIGKGLGDLGNFGSAFGQSIATPASSEGSLASAIVGGIVSTGASGFATPYIESSISAFCDSMAGFYDSFSYSTAQFFEAYDYAYWDYYGYGY
jgi:RHS repeat-associated protein